MKNMIIKLLVFSTMLLLPCPAALCQTDPLAGIAIENGWMTGTVTAHFGVGDESEFSDEIKVDCPEPSEAYPAEILTVVNGYVNKEQMQTALKAADQNIEGKFVHPRGSAIYTGDWNKEAGADITKEEAAAQAIEIGLKYFDALGVEVDPVPYSVSRPYDYDAYMEEQICRYEHQFSDISTFVENARTSWKRKSKYNPKQSEYTAVYFDVLLGGMRLAKNPSYPAGYEDEPDAWIGLPIGAHVVVSDSGILVEASCTLLEIKKRRPLDGDPAYMEFIHHLERRKLPIIEADSWQAALNDGLADGLHVHSNSEDEPYQNKYMTAPIISYGSKSVITKIYPVLHAISKDEWAPFWMIDTEREYSDGWRD